MENSAPQTQYVGHVFMDVIFRFSPPGLYVRQGLFLVMPHVAAPKPTPDSTGALFWLDGEQMQIPPHPPSSYMTSPTEPTWFPSGRLDIRMWTEEEGETPGTWQAASGPGSTCLPHQSVTFLQHLTARPLTVCLSESSSGAFLCNIPALLPPLLLIHFLTNLKVFWGLTQAPPSTFNTLNQPLNNADHLPAKRWRIPLTE